MLDDVDLSLSGGSSDIRPHSPAGEDDFRKPLKDQSTVPTSHATKVFAIKVAFAASIGGLLFGYDIGVIAGALDSLADEMNLNHIEQGLVVSILYIGYVFGSLIGGLVTDRFGRKLTIIWVDLIFVVGASLLAFAPNIGTCAAQSLGVHSER